MGKLKILSWLFSPRNKPVTNDDSGNRSHRRSLSSSKRIKTGGGSSQSKKEDQPSSEPRMAVLAEKIRTETEKLEAYIKLNGLAEPGFAVDAPADFPPLPAELQKSRQEVIHATRELSTLVRGPRETVRFDVWNCLDVLSLQIISNYGIAKLVPIDAPIKLTELQTKTPLDPVNLARVLRHAMTNRIFQEPSPGLIAHTAASRLLAEDAALQNWVGYNCEEVFPAAAHVLQALRDQPEATSWKHTGFNAAFDTFGKEPIYATFERDPPRARRMGAAMSSLTGGEGYQVSYFVDNYDLSDVNERGGTFVDIGGSHGFASVDLAKRWKKMKFVVQDLPKTIASAPKPICEDESVAERIELQAHDFFQEQPVKNADVYYFRWIIHNFATPLAVSILKSLAPALKPGARVVINDYCLREPGSESPWDERLARSMDMIMLALLNAQERVEREFRELFEAADARFEFKGVERVAGCKMSVIEAVWNPDKIVAHGGDSGDGET